MRATTALAGVSATLVLAGCGTVLELAQVPAECADTTTNTVTTITVKYGPGLLGTDKECAKVKPGDSVKFVFSPMPSARGTAHTKFPGLGHGWLDHSDDDSPGTIMMTAPKDAGGDHGEAKSYKYEIRVDKVGRLDPRIVVQ